MPRPLPPALIKLQILIKLRFGRTRPQVRRVLRNMPGGALSLPAPRHTEVTPDGYAPSRVSQGSHAASYTVRTCNGPRGRLRALRKVLNRRRPLPTEVTRSGAHCASRAPGHGSPLAPVPRSAQGARFPASTPSRCVPVSPRCMAHPRPRGIRGTGFRAPSPAAAPSRRGPHLTPLPYGRW